MTEFKFNTQFTARGIPTGEYFEPDTSETEPNQAIDIKTVYERCTRGGVLPPIAPPEAYDIKPGMSLEEAFDTVLPNDIDLADISIAQQILTEASKGKTSDERSEELPTQKASDERVLETEGAATTMQDK